MITKNTKIQLHFHKDSKSLIEYVKETLKLEFPEFYPSKSEAISLIGHLWGMICYRLGKEGANIGSLCFTLEDQRTQQQTEYYF